MFPLNALLRTDLLTPIALQGQVEQIIRLGRRSQSEVLEKLGIHHLVREMQQTRIEGQEKARLYGTFDVEMDVVAELLLRLSNVTSLNAVREHLEINHPEHFTELFRSSVDEDGFQLVQARESDRLRAWLQGSSSRSNALPVVGMSNSQHTVSNPRPIAILAESTLRSMTNMERRLLYDNWIAEIAGNLNDDLVNALESYNEAKAALDKCNQEISLRCLLQAQVIGCTTTGLARNLEVLRKVRTKIVLVEEAGKDLAQHSSPFPFRVLWCRLVQQCSL